MVQIQPGNQRALKRMSPRGKMLSSLANTVVKKDIILVMVRGIFQT